jgi:hypothetical protein
LHNIGRFAGRAPDAVHGTREEARELKYRYGSEYQTLLLAIFLNPELASAVGKNCTLEEHHLVRMSLV